MANYDFFDLTGLPFDPPEKSAKKVKASIDKKIKEMGTSLGSESQQEKRDEINGQIKFLNDTAATIFVPDGKKVVESTYSALAESRTQSEIAKLKATANLMALTGKVITEAAIRDFRKERKLSDDHVREVFASLGFTIKSFEGIDVASLFPRQIKKTDEYISALSKTKDPNPNGADTSLVVDLYSFAAYLMDEPESAVVYRGKTTNELLSIFDSFSKKFSQRNDNLGKLCASIATAAKTYVFNSDENRGKYEFHLKYKTPVLDSLFDSMRGVPEQVLLESGFAEPCIKQIAETLNCSYEIALAVYNKEGNVLYSPKTSVYLVKCQFCGTMNQYPSEQDAIKSNSCSNCKKELFKKCNKCGRMVLASLDKCPHVDCGFVFASATLFSKYYSLAEQALRKSDFELARKYLFDAQSADPSEKRRIEQLTSKINSEEERYKKPLGELRALISAKMFVKAQEELPWIIQKYPNLNITDIEKTIIENIANADSSFVSAQRLTASKRADACMLILQRCADHKPSINFLRATQPVPCSDLKLSVNTRKGCINVSWAISEEQGVKYCLVRKNGKTPSASISDGTLLLDNVDSSFFCDETVTSGCTYTYSLFVSRMDVFSDATFRTAVLYSDVKNLNITQVGKSIRLTWDMPDNSMGATITRTANGKTTVLSRTAHGSFEDSDIQYRVSYAYNVTVNYANSIRSPGVEAVITPLVIIDSFQIKVAHVKDDVYKVSWDIKSPSIDLRIMVNRTLVSQCNSDVSFTQVSLPREGFNVITVMAYSGGKWIESENSIQVNTFSPCPIDKKRTELVEESITTPSGIVNSVNLKIRLSKEIPNNVVGFYCTVRTSTSASRWATLEEIGTANDVRRIGIKEYKNNNGILISESVTNERTFYISVFTIYDVRGKEIISDPKTAKVDRMLSADLFWKVSKGLFGSLKLTFSIAGNRPIDRIPELVLCGCNDGEFLTAYDDSKAVELKHINSLDLEEPQDNYTKSYELDKSSYHKGMKFFLFEKNPTQSEKFTIRWCQGFKGKV